MSQYNHISSNKTISNVKILNYSHGWERTDSPVVAETSLSIYLNRKHIVTLMCTDNSREFLAIGFLAVERFIEPNKVEQIKIAGFKDGAIYIEAPFLEEIPRKNKKTIPPSPRRRT